MPASSRTIDRIDVTFDYDRAAANAGLLLTGTLLDRLGLEQAADKMVSVGYRPGRKHAGATSRIIGHDTVAASTIGTWLRQVTFGHVHPLDRVTETMLAQAWAAGAGPG